jgi:hypothetical protein
MFSAAYMFFASLFDNDHMPAWIILFGGATVLIGASTELFGKSQDQTIEELPRRRKLLWTGFSLTVIGMVLTICAMFLRASS